MKASDPIDDTIRNIVGRSLPQSLSMIGDQSGFTTSSHEQTIPNYQNITSLDEERFGNTDEYLTSFLNKGYHEDISRDKIRTKISWVQSSCICKDIFCQKTAAIDLIGVSQSDNGDFRGEVPIVLVDEIGDDLPCLSHSRLPPVSELDIEGCSWDSLRKVKDCDSGKVQSLRFIDKKSALVVARALSDTETIPQLARFDPDKTLINQLNDTLLQIPESIVDIETTISTPNPFFPTNDIEFDVTFSPNLAPALNTAKDQMVTAVFNAIFGGLRPEDFPPNRPASEAPFVDIVRMSDAFTKNSLLLSIREFGGNANSTIYASPLHMTLKGQRPETSPPAEIASGAGLLVISSCAFGFIVGSVWRKGAFLKCHGFFSIFTAFAVFLLEGVAYALRWSSEVAQSSFQEAMVLVAVTAADRFDGLTPLGVGKDGRPFIVTTYVVELTDDSMSSTWFFVLGLIISIFGLGVSMFLAKHRRFGPLFED
eukprot:CAMPEP_0195509950 /NCGR_PEP_ID=MMETSP0794_2-20130614/2731_1 /TAXON_ID=515487 /ORGANISM="Stephanopyxis turris, Strain CCMP 815" /LENGTH=480 /DNA_ID=CAMNT_0040637289 /DNA_START=41 /DNA_END=1483 /DNA_ORIENTATION=+